MIGSLSISPRADILSPETQQFPYWPDWYFQPSQNIAAQQETTKEQDIVINRIPTLETYNNNDVGSIIFPQSPTQQITDAQALQASTVIYGVGSGATLMDMLSDSVAAQRAQGRTGA